MNPVGVILDIPDSMGSITCVFANEFEEDPVEAAGKSVGNFVVAANKFPRHVLVVDDEPLIRWSVAESLSDLGMDVEQAGDAASALRKVTTAALPFDIIILDLRLPDMRDLSLLATLRQLLPSAQLILMTAFDTPDVDAEAALLGVTVLNKPFELDHLTRLALETERRPS